jgi:hypothetical protein
VRLPFTWKDLNMAPKNLDKDCSPVTVDQLKQRLISPHVLDKYRNKPIPGNVSPMHNSKQGYCNTCVSFWSRNVTAVCCSALVLGGRGSSARCGGVKTLTDVSKSAVVQLPAAP